MSEFVLPNLQRERIIRGIKEGIRLDGRKPIDFREIKIEKDISNNAESSVSLKIGNTEVYCGVKMGLTEPYPDSPDEGTFMMSAELHPMSSNEFDIGKPGIDAIELARVVDRGIRESGFIDFKGLCIKEGEKAWQIFVDIITLNDDGNLFDVAALAALIALGNAKLPVYNEEENKIEQKLSDKPLPINKDLMSWNLTLYKIGDELVFDPSKEEEFISDYRISLAIADNNGKPRITAIQKGKEGVISEEELEKILNLVEEKFNVMFPKIKEYIIN
ncbi:MAG: RNA-binding protein [Candidatus Nanoarchaeia archaeon]|jgi:exosome complex component RRP42|nr:RNA-binding protein [Candidatus Nanoarchaeia archaeon]MDD3993911.1 RNA-binding protein [Candidatus Nanoarchaeia archaeon]MDD4563375.1 RNA-binding protein [Candidatus Nanoarchaeia archaeon]